MSNKTTGQFLKIREHLKTAKFEIVLATIEFQNIDPIAFEKTVTELKNIIGDLKLAIHLLKQEQP